MLTGRVAGEVELRITPIGKAVTTFSLASCHEIKVGDAWREQIQQFQVVAWDGLAERCANYLGQGSRILIEGRLHTRQWQDRQSQKHYLTEVVALNFLMLSSRTSNNSGSPYQGTSHQNGLPSAHQEPALSPIYLPVGDPLGLGAQIQPRKRWQNDLENHLSDANDLLLEIDDVRLEPARKKPKAVEVDELLGLEFEKAENWIDDGLPQLEKIYPELDI